MSRVKQVVAIGTIPIFPGAPKKDGGHKEGQLGRVACLRLSQGDNVRGKIAGPEKGEVMMKDPKMIESIIQAFYGVGRHIDFRGIKGTR